MRGDVKICSACREEKADTCFYANPKMASGLCSYCKDCMLQKKKKWIADNKERHLEWWRKFSKERYRRDPVAAKEKVSRSRNSEKGKRTRKQESARRVGNLQDGYVRALLRQQTNLGEVPKELIELKREQILLKRCLKRLFNQIGDQNGN